MKKKFFGKCHICGLETELSFEHIPPKKAFNNHAILYKSLAELMAEDQGKESKGIIDQRGFGRHSLCSPCNNNTGKWYGMAFVQWACYGMDILGLTRLEPNLHYSLNIYPLRVIKQILSMFCSINNPYLTENYKDIRRFLLNKNEKYVPSGIRIYVYYCIGPGLRSVALTGRRNWTNNISRFDVISEMTYPPYGYVLSFDENTPDDRLYDITYFGRYGYDEKAYVSLKLPVLPVHTWFPGDYRNEKQVEDDVGRNLAMKEHMNKMKLVKPHS